MAGLMNIGDHVRNTDWVGCELHGSHRPGMLVGVIESAWERSDVGVQIRVKWLIDTRARENFGRLAVEDEGRDACVTYMKVHEIRLLDAIELLGALA